MLPAAGRQERRAPFKQRKCFGETGRQGCPGERGGRLPVILEQYPKEKVLPALDRTKFLVPQELTMGQFVTIIRNRMSLSSTQSFYLLVDGSRSLVSMSLTMAEVYTLNQDEDGFLYMTYASQEIGCLDRLAPKGKISLQNEGPLGLEQIPLP
uniref:Microtubule associated protein 1 light chain 3 gamma n=1 Tax=Pelusios castaneus TaxID=367368 RepID=A0A8C8RTW5_9SAUR